MSWRRLFWIGIAMAGGGIALGLAIEQWWMSATDFGSPGFLTSVPYWLTTVLSRALWSAVVPAGAVLAALAVVLPKAMPVWTDPAPARLSATGPVSDGRAQED
ncbi:hypothetical protein [Demequina sp.]|uniref:hypothetical protein n=1 Tax=Demequina sp. TaxID=2050685 RepID=UPI0025FC1640|nr:hypothetical protein [Demequina sp.]